MTKRYSVLSLLIAGFTASIISIQLAGLTAAERPVGNREHLIAEMARDLFVHNPTLYDGDTRQLLDTREVVGRYFEMADQFYAIQKKRHATD